MAFQYSVLGQAAPTAANLTDIYTVPASTQTIISSVVIANRSTIATAFRLSVAVAGLADTTKQYLAQDVPISGNETKTMTLGVTMGATDVFRVYNTLATCSFNLFGVQVS